MAPNFPAPVPGPIGAAAAGRRSGVSAPARARRLRGMGQPARPLARLSRPVGADLAARRAEPRRATALRLSRYAEDWRTDQGYNFFIFRNDDEALAGGVGLSNMRRGVAETASLGYWIGEPFARQRYMSAALPLVLDFAFDRLRLHRVEAACLPSNVPSRALAAAHRLPAGRLRPPLPADRRQMAGPPAVRDPARGLARLSSAPRDAPSVPFAVPASRRKRPQVCSGASRTCGSGSSAKRLSFICPNSEAAR